MGWPPQVGELLPYGDEAIGVRYKLATYSLNPVHPDGGPKARGFERILGITVDAIDHLEREIEEAILVVPIGSIRVNRTGALNCVIEFPLRGVDQYRTRKVSLRTAWELVGPTSRPRLVSAFLRP
jgi:hypothetical protein